ncbi:hypothetical protein AB0C34_24490 [Nocardia sp. NPDC049220]|uniref:hypothetical protein n=1 Tax=Nocardia sp. NPDC049220 TaxID=3155273 RepID=UPI0033E4419D
MVTVLAALVGHGARIHRRPGPQGRESARGRGKTAGDANITDPDMLAMAIHLRDQQLSLRDIATGLVITTGTKEAVTPHPRRSCACTATA